jgi:hypothetical protein
MAVHLLEFQVNLPYKSGVPKDTSINTFHIHSAVDYDEAVGLALIEKVSDFYGNLGGSQNAILDTYLSKFIDGPHCRIDLSEISGWDTGAPVWNPIGSVPMPLTITGAGTDMPLEVASCLSYSGVLGLPPYTGPFPKAARRRGRIYFGPLNSGAYDFDTGNGRPVVSENFRNNLSSAAVVLAQGINTLDAGNQRWCVWSRTGSHAIAIDRGYVNNDFDTQRRRGSGETARSTWQIT